MVYLLDTSVLIELLRQSPATWNFIKQRPEDEMTSSAICEAEVWERVFREDKQKFAMRQEILQRLLSSIQRIIPFDSSQAQIAGQLRATLGTRGETIGDLDILIAAAAKATNTSVVTKNPKHFSRIPNLSVISV